MTMRRSAYREIVALLGGQLFDSPWLRRLGKVSFLGPLQALETGTATATRLEHALSVAWLGYEFVHRTTLPVERQRLFVAACLLHDIGHFPLSHAAEPAIRERLGVDHHGLGRWIVLGEGAVGRARSLRPILEHLRLDPLALWRLIDGSDEDDDLGRLLHAPINLDTIDGILRVARAFRLPKLAQESLRLHWIEETCVILPEAMASFDAFWRLKQRVYEEVINRPSNVLAEARLCALVKERATPQLFEWLEDFDDHALLRRLGLAASTILPLVQDDHTHSFCAQPSAHDVLHRTCRRYVIEATAGLDRPHLPLRKWPERFRHEKYTAHLVTHGEQLHLPGLFTLQESPEI